MRVLNVDSKFDAHIYIKTIIYRLTSWTCSTKVKSIFRVQCVHIHVIGMSA